MLLNAFHKLENAGEASHDPILMENCPTCSYMSCSYQFTEWSVITPFQVMCRARDSVATREMPLEKEVEI